MGQPPVRAGFAATLTERPRVRDAAPRAALTLVPRGVVLGQHGGAVGRAYGSSGPPAGHGSGGRSLGVLAVRRTHMTNRRSSGVKWHSP
jgi:hypothetical protein